MCRQWNTEAWLKRSVSGTSNRNTRDSGGNISRHTRGSIGYDEHRIRLVKELRTQLENANMETTLLRQNQEKMQQQLAQLMTQVGILTRNSV
ncbi:hypothetical protein L2E82_15092 [Cichorium intybus]|uniref:Uncharacterized protein n=1 Tax=Cichorium intybus TaxID=13427 RepID=A0ACB9F168_CICIN|nr:hypothetical protein L2E82_15092 [Cichorium intybus]